MSQHEIDRLKVMSVVLTGKRTQPSAVHSAIRHSGRTPAEPCPSDDRPDVTARRPLPSRYGSSLAEISHQTEHQTGGHFNFGE